MSRGSLPTRPPSWVSRRTPILDVLRICPCYATDGCAPSARTRPWPKSRHPGLQDLQFGDPKPWILGIWTSRFDPSWVPTHGTPIRLSRMAPGPHSILDVYRICSLGGPLRYPPSGRIRASSVLWSGTDLDLPKWVILGVRGPDFGVPNHLFLATRRRL